MNVLWIMICKERLIKACGLFRSGASHTPINSNMNHVANQLIFKTISVQKILSFSPKNLKTFSKKIFKYGFAHFLKTGAIYTRKTQLKAVNHPANSSGLL